MVAKYKNLPESGRIASAGFPLKVAVNLCKMGTNLSLSKRRSLESEIQAEKHKDFTQHVLAKAVRQN